MDRRGFLKAILATGIAPYVVTTAGVLMPVKTIVKASTLDFVDEVVDAEDPVIAYSGKLPLFYGDMIHDDAPAINAFSEGKQVLRADGTPFTGTTMNDDVMITQSVTFTPAMAMRNFSVQQGEVPVNVTINSTITCGGLWSMEGTAKSPKNLDFQDGGGLYFVRSGGGKGAASFGGGGTVIPAGTVVNNKDFVELEKSTKMNKHNKNWTKLRKEHWNG